ncbi:MAG: trypsin-like peptidase domain-containing protein [Chloroflexi bacterium]|nr:MAG: trypsin-like peptidase domain-containing protein [Chloroflexota bacterium]
MPTCVCGELLLADHRFCAACGREQVSAWGLAAVEPPGRRRSVVSTVTAAALALMVVLGVAFAVGYRSASLAPQVVARFIPGPFATPTSSLVSQPLGTVADHAMSRVVTVEVQTSGGEEFGTGWVFDTHGDVVTNNHVIEGGSTIRLVDGGKQVHSGVVVGRDPAQDIAMVRSLDGLSVAPLPLATDGPAPHPEQVVVLASTKATNHSDRTVETLALLGQSIPVQGEGLAGAPGSGGTTYTDMMVLHGEQIYRGNSGGPVLDSYGRVVGVVTLASQSTPQAFAIPIIRVVTQLRGYAARSNPAS